MSNKKVNLKKTQQVISAAIVTLLLGCSTTALAGGFQLMEENVTNMGNAYAGTGAQADDASTQWYNPAGMVRLDNPQFVLSGSYIDVNIHGHVATTTDQETLQNPIFGLTTATSILNRNESVTSATSAVIPAFSFVYPICHKIAFGLGATAPFGLETQYPADSSMAFLATSSSIQTVDVGPSLAIAITPQFSVGAGVDAQYMSATLDEQIPFNESIIAPHILPNQTLNIGSFINEGDDWGWGWHAGILYQLSQDTRFGLAYHSRVNHTLTGRALAKLTTPTINFSIPIPIFGPLNINVPQEKINTFGHFSSDITLPDYVDFSAYHAFNPQWAVLGSVDYTRWSLINVNTANFGPDISDLIPQANLVFNFRNTWRVSTGVDYKPAPKWTLRSGVAFDESPVRNSTTRTWRLPDSNRYWVSLGAQYIITREFTVDAGYSHLFVKHSNINNAQTIAGNFPFLGNSLPFTFVESAAGDISTSVNEVGLQLTWNII